MLALHRNAAKTRLEAHPLLAGAVDDVVRTTFDDVVVRDNYVIMSVTIPGFEGDRLTEEQSPTSDAIVTIKVRVVAVDMDGLLQWMDAVSAQLLGPRLEVAGRNVGALTRELDEPVFDRVARLVYMDAYFEATTSRA